MIRRTAILIILLFFRLAVFANEGMWIPLLLESLNEADMQANGLKLSAEDIYSINKSSLKDAIVLFGGGCTSELISDKGLLLTNHHCGYSRIQAHSSVENDYLKNGFWAKTGVEELANPGLTATLLVRMEDVTKSVLEGVTEEMNKETREQLIAINMNKVTSKVVKGAHYKASIKPFNYGNEFYLFITEEFTDIRLVGTPPSSIGKYGADEDNWMWPRHTGDFSVFRIYASKENKPADYSVDNVPYKPKHVLPISLKGIKEGDFTMIYGFPGKTEQHLTSYAVDHLINVSNPAKIGMREASLSIINAAMQKSDEVRIQYSAKQSRISNAYKKWIGQNKGLKKSEALKKKRDFEKEFLRKAMQTETTKKKYGLLFQEFKSLYHELETYSISKDYFYELVLYGPEIIKFSHYFSELETATNIKETVEKLKRITKSHFKNYHKSTDQLLFEVLMKKYDKGMHKGLLAEDFEGIIHKKFKENYGKLARVTYKKSIFSSEEKVMSFLNSFSEKSLKILQKDPAYKLKQSIYKSYKEKVNSEYVRLTTAIDDKMRIYVEGIMELFPNKTYWPDANRTLRLAYGKVQGASIYDGMKYHYFTTLDGAVKKYKPNDRDFDMPKKLLELYHDKDYGRYGQDSTMVVCFIASNHTTGGNSGSPALNGNGELIGLNFDRSWESTMSDIMYDQDICRNIMVDIRYVLFIIDKFAGAHHLINEMKIIE